MRIRYKFFLVVLPLVILPVLIAGLASALVARNEITRIAQDSLEFKAEQLRGYADSQWRLLEENGLTGEPQYVRAAQNAVESHALGLIRSSSELIFAVDESGEPTFSTAPVDITAGERRTLSRRHEQHTDEWSEVQLEDVSHVAQSAYFQPFDWTFFVTERRDSFYGVINRMYVQSATIAGVSLAASLLLLLVFARHLLRPLNSMAAAMRHIMSSNDLSHRVPLFYQDEFGDLGHTFNLMTTELEKAYDQIKQYAYQTVIARKQERKVRNVFQRYVPLEVLNQVFAHPESMLVGENRKLSVLFSDIRDFTSIAESLPPGQLVASLNDYFTRVVDLVYDHNGIVDKYIGDAVMAFFGAPVKHDNDALLAVETGLDMLDTVEAFNRNQRTNGQPEFRTGIGVSFGPVTVGNVGSERKMDYTVMGDTVNLASRLEGLTKTYGVPMLISETVAKHVNPTVPCRFVDAVMVKGKHLRTKVFTPRRALTEGERKGWKLYHAALRRYYARTFEDARRYLTAAGKHLPGDPLVALFLDRCETYLKQPPPEGWNGAVVISEK
ncbi:MAG: adenylate/guanylate cyclase domain-containing protein [Spirochaetaceae bacterium]